MIGQFRPQPIAVTQMASRPMRLDRSWASGEAIAGAWQQQATPSKGVQTICLSEALPAEAVRLAANVLPIPARASPPPWAPVVP